MRRLAQAALAGLLALAALDVPAFDEAGHFYTAYALVRTGQTSDGEKGRMLLALCAQLPDMASDLDATSVYWRAIKGSPWAWTKWGIASSIDSDEIRKMITIQQQLHALTGGKAEVVQRVAQASARKPRDRQKPDASPLQRGIDLCAYGFSLHYLADSYAHQRLDDTRLASSARRMYDTGTGHAADLHYPDYALCAELASPPRWFNHCKFSDDPKLRFEAWRQMWLGAPNPFDRPDFVLKDGSTRKSVLNKVIALSGNASDRNNWNEEGMRKALSVDPGVEAYRAFIDAHPSDRSCEEVLKEALVKLDELAPYAGLTCAAVWDVYRKAILDAYAQPDAQEARAALKVPFEQAYVENPLGP